MQAPTQTTGKQASQPPQADTQARCMHRRAFAASHMHAEVLVQKTTSVRTSASALARLSAVWPPMVGRIASGRSCQVNKRLVESNQDNKSHCKNNSAVWVDLEYEARHSRDFTLSRICSTSSGVIGPMYVRSAVPGSVIIVACSPVEARSEPCVTLQGQQRLLRRPAAKCM